MRPLILSSVLSTSAIIINQESFNSYAQMETLLVKAANGDNYESEFKFLGASHSQDVDTGMLPGQLSVLYKLC